MHWIAYQNESKESVLFYVVLYWLKVAFSIGLTRKLWRNFYPIWQFNFDTESDAGFHHHFDDLIGSVVVIIGVDKGPLFFV